MQIRAKPLLLYNDECGVCRRIARWVERSAHDKAGESNIDVKPIGDDPKALRALDPNLSIWDAYATIHMLLPDGSTKLGGEAVAEVLRRSPQTQWFAWTFAIGIWGFRPFQAILNLSYAILADVRPLFGCESCGIPRPWLKPIVSTFSWIASKLWRHPQLSMTKRSSPLSPTTAQPNQIGALRSWPVAPKMTGVGKHDAPSNARA